MYSRPVFEKTLDKANYKKYLKNLKRFLTNCDVR